MSVPFLHENRRDRAFPKYFYTFLHQYIHSVTESASESSGAGAIDNNMFSSNSEPQDPPPKTDADEKIERIYHDFDKISFFLGLETRKKPVEESDGRVYHLLTRILF